MNPALASLLALLIAIIISMTSRLNVGLIAIALGWLVGVYIAGLKAEAVMGGFPASLFLTLAGVTLLFACAEANGTLERLASRAVSLARGNVRLLPLIFFLIALVISTIGPGAISAVALVVPLAMSISTRAGVPAFLTALVVANGANAGNLSPISSVGVIANAKMAEAGLGGHEGKVWFANFIIHALVAAAAYWLFGGRRLRGERAAEGEEAAEREEAAGGMAFAREHVLTIAVIVIWIAGVLVAKLSLGLSAFAASTVLIAARAADEAQAVRKVPWGVILMVSGVSLLVALLEKTGGMELFTGMLAHLSTPGTINGVMAFVTGAISSYSSTSGVVLPAFLPTVPGLIERIGGGDALSLALSINVGSSLVDVSPLSTLGALCVATIEKPVEAKLLFRQLLIWGLSMTVVGAVFCQLFAGWIARM